MNYNLITKAQKSFFTSLYPLILILIVAAVFLLWSPYFEFSREGLTRALIGTPKYWFDEASPTDAARGLVELGRIDIGTEPGKLSGRPYYVNSPGYPVVLTLAGVFKAFGIGVLQVRLVAIAWLLVTVVVGYLVWRKMFGAEAAFWGTLLVVTFSSFYAGGKTIVGTVPAVLFLFLALYILYEKRNYFWGGLFAGLALVTKPSLFLLLAPAFLIEFLIWERPNLWRGMLKTALGALIPVVVWLFVMFPNPFDGALWKDALTIYGNHYPEPSLLSRLTTVGGWRALFNSTGLYFFGLLALAAIAWSTGAFEGSQKRVVNFFLVYSAFALFYFLLSPGWWRYLLPFQMLVLMLVFPSARSFMSEVQPLTYARVGVLFLVTVQVIVFMWFAEIRSSLDIPRLADYINKELLTGNNDVIGVINSNELAALISDQRKYQIVNCGGPCRFGTHPLSVKKDKLPRYVIVSRRHLDSISPYEDVLTREYNPEPAREYGFLIYEKRFTP